MWFKQYYRCFLPTSSDHDAKKYKMFNAGVVAFELTRGTTDAGKFVYRIEPKTVDTVYLGFKKK